MNIYNSNWILRPLTFKIMSAPTLPIGTTVSLLINEENKWNEDLIRYNIMPIDAKQIMKI